MTVKMAEGGCVEDMQRTLMCNICEQGGISARADHFCVSCEQYLCDDCKLYHSRVKATRSHHVVGTDEIPSFTSLTLTSEAMETPTCKDHKRPITNFCISHMDELCPSCRLMEHKRCENITEFKKAVQSVFTEEHKTRINSSLDELIHGFDKCKSKAQRNRDSLCQSKQSAIDDVKQARKTIDNHLDKVEAEAYAEIDKVFKAEMKQLDDLLHVCDVTIDQLQKRLSRLERATALDDKESEFVIINNVTKDIKRHCDLLKDSVDDTCDIDFTFFNSDNTAKIARIMPNLGKVSVTKSPDSQSDTGTVAIYTGELKASTTTDTGNPFIASYECLPDGKQLLTDRENNTLKLYDINNQFISELTLPDMPWNVVLLKDHEAVASLPSIKSLNYISIGTGLAVSETKKVNYKPWAMVKYGKDILATVRDRFWKVYLIDNRGTVKRTIYEDNGTLFNRPACIGISVDQKTVYVVDMDKGCIGLSMDGNVVFQYQDQIYYHYDGLAVGRDCLFICVDQGSGTKVRRLMLSGSDEEDLELGKSYPLKTVESTLIVTNYDEKGECCLRFFYLS